MDRPIKTHRTKQRAQYCLPKELTTTLVSGYNTKLRHRIVTRLEELKGAGKTPIAELSRIDILQMALESEQKAIRNEPYQEKIKSGYMDVKLGKWDHPEKGLQRSVTSLVTGKGLARIEQLYRNESI